MVGIGCGALVRAHCTTTSDHYGVARASVAQILRSYVDAPVAQASRRRAATRSTRTSSAGYVIQSLLTWPGLADSAYVRAFRREALRRLAAADRTVRTRPRAARGDVVALTANGMAQAETIGLARVAGAVQERMDGYAAA